MKKTIIMLAVVMGLGVLEGRAQTTETKVSSEQLVPHQATPEERAERETRKMTKELTLTTEQQDKFKTFSLERINTIASLQKKMNASTDQAEKEQLQNDIKTARDKFDTNVKSILTAEQLPKWETKKEQRLDNKRILHKEKAVPGNH